MVPMMWNFPTKSWFPLGLDIALKGASTKKHTDTYGTRDLNQQSEFCWAFYTLIHHDIIIRITSYTFMYHDIMIYIYI